MNILDPELDLFFERTVQIPRALIWKAWTEPQYLKQWFTPAPWKTIDCEIDLRPGGIFRTLMQSPEGKEFPGVGSYLEVVENRRLVWTNALAPGFRPAAIPADGFAMTAIIDLSDHGSGTRYSATVLHENVTARRQHEAMNFEAGWGKAFDQLVAMVRAW